MKLQLRFLILIVFYSLNASAIHRAPYYFRQPADPSAITPPDAIDVKHYRFRIELNDTTDIISGTAEISLLCKKNLTQLELDLISKNAQGKGMQVTGITLQGTVLKFSHQNDLVKIFLTSPAAINDLLKLKITYRGIPNDGLIISKNKYGDRTFFADNWPNRGRNWIPVVDHPADKAAVDFIIIAPLHYDVVANGVKIEQSFLNARQKLTHYTEQVDIPTKVMVIGVARFAVQQAGVVDQTPVESWVYPQNSNDGFSDYAVAVKVLDFFIGHIGPYPYKKLANVQSKTTFGGLENASAIFYHENSVTGKNNQEGLIAHEIAHQWFGDSATELDWHHVWLSEGFATYFALLYSELVHGEDKRRSEMKIDRDQVIAYFKKNPQPVVNVEITDLMKLLNPNSYQKGSWVLHMLRREIGDENFRAGVREYYRKYRDSNALTADLKSIMEDVSGKDLKLFFEQWIFTAGHPVLDGSWSYDEAAKTLHITLNQVQKGAVFNFPLEIGVFQEGDLIPRIEKVRIDKQAHKFTIPMSAKPNKIALDPAINLLFEGNLRN